MLQNAVVFTLFGQHGAHIGKASRPSQCAHMQRVFFSLLDQVVGDRVEGMVQRQEPRFCFSRKCLIAEINVIPWCDFAVAPCWTGTFRVDSRRDSCGEAVIVENPGKWLQLARSPCYHKQVQGSFPHVDIVYLAAVTIDVSSSTSENTFSTLRRVLRPKRRSMSHQRKSALVILAYEIRSLPVSGSGHVSWHLRQAESPYHTLTNSRL